MTLGFIHYVFVRQSKIKMFYTKDRLICFIFLFEGRFCVHVCLSLCIIKCWSNHVTNVGVLDQVEITSVKAMLLKSQLRETGYVSKTGGGSLPA